MLPGSTSSRSKEAALGKQSGRTMEIQRLIGRSLRTALNFKAIGENTIKVDCDVLQADGGTRTCAITGGFIALYLCLKEKFKHNFNYESFFFTKSLQYPQVLLMIKFLLILIMKKIQIVMLI